MMPPSSNQKHRWMSLAVLGTAQLMVVLDATVVNIALPSAQRALHFSSSTGASFQQRQPAVDHHRVSRPRECST